MSLLEVMLLALALSADAFSVALAVGLRHASGRQRFRLSWHFGLFQAIMPLAGAGGGAALLRLVGDVDHYVAFAVLELIAAKMLWGAFRRRDDPDGGADPTRGWSLVALSLATSIDAFGAGIGLALAKADLVVSCLVIGVTAGVATFLGMRLGAGLGLLVGRWSTALGGTVLAILGVRMLWI